MVCGIREAQLHKTGLKQVQDCLCEEYCGIRIGDGPAVGYRAVWLETAYMIISASAAKIVRYVV